MIGKKHIMLELVSEIAQILAAEVPLSILYTGECKSRDSLSRAFGSISFMLKLFRGTI